MNENPVNPPAHLSEAAAKFFAEVEAMHYLTPAHVRLLTLACEALDRGREARELLDAEGMTYADRFGQPKPRPEVAIERDSRLAFARLAGALGLDAGMQRAVFEFDDDDNETGIIGDDRMSTTPTTEHNHAEDTGATYITSSRRAG